MSRLIPSVNDLETWCYQNNRLDLIEEWDSERNFPLTPSKIARGSNRSVYWVCRKCGYEWQRSVNGRAKVHNGSGCKLCNKSMPPKKKIKYTPQNFQQHVDKKGIDVIVISQYIDWDTKVTCVCKKCGHSWDALPSNLLAGHGCKVCSQANAAAARRGNILKIQKVLDSYNFKTHVFGIYKNNSSSVTCRCLVCGHQWDITAKLLVERVRKGINPCAYCNKAANQKKQAESFLERVQLINPYVKVLSPYVRTDMHVQCECTICGHIYPVLPLNLLKGRKCPQCTLQKASERLRDSHDEFLGKLSEVNADIKVVGEYVNQDTQIECVCSKCGNTWFPVPYHLLNGAGCPCCKQSRGEKAIQIYLEKNFIQYESQKRFSDCRYKATLPFDFYLPQKNMCIEFDGIQHYEPLEIFGGMEAFEETRKRDQIKSNYCLQKGITLLRIPYFEDIEAVLNAELKNSRGETIQQSKEGTIV